MRYRSWRDSAAPQRLAVVQWCFAALGPPLALLRLIAADGRMTQPPGDGRTPAARGPLATARDRGAADAI